MLKLDSSGNWDLYSYGSGGLAILGSGTYTTGASVPVRIKFNSTSPLCEVYINGSLKYNAAGGSGFGGVAFGGDKPKFDNVKIGYDNNGDDDIDDAGDDVVINESFSSTSQTVSYDHAGNLIDDGRFQYVYDAWNRLIKVRSAVDTDVTFQTAEFFADGRRAKKVVTNSAPYDRTEVYFYDGQKIIEMRDGSGNVKSAFGGFIHGTQYIDELVMMRAKDKGDLYVHQDANWNVIALTDLGRHFVERYVYTPYGEVIVHQDTSWGDRDGDEDVDSTDKGTVGTTCTGTVTGSCRILDLDFDGDYDSTDATKFDALPQGIARHPGKFASGVDQPFGHQGLQYEAEVAQYQNRARQYDPGKRRFGQRDPFTNANDVWTLSSQYHDGIGLYWCDRGNPLRLQDPLGTTVIIQELIDIIGAANRVACSIGVEVGTSIPIGSKYGPAFSHCLSHCLIKRHCGGDGPSFATGSLTEQMQGWVCRQFGGPSGTCNSADQTSDWWDNQLGRNVAGGGGSCYCGCKAAMGGSTNHPEGPGTNRPYGPQGNPPGPGSFPAGTGLWPPMPPVWGP